jgi:FkbM family methyltransferase
MSKIYYSQFNQDQIINTLLENKKGGVFIDIGAYDGITFSNSYFFEKTNGWTGICFEPNPIIFKKLAEARTCTLINGGVSVKNDSLTYKRFSGNQELEMLSGFSDFFSEEQLARIEKELGEEKNSSTEIIEVQTYSLNDLLKEKQANKIDYCSIDTEGGEFDILKTINFDDTYFAALSIEDNYDSKIVIDYMKSKGFEFQFIWKADLFFINKKENTKLSSKLKLSKYYINYHLKKAAFVYKPLNFLYKTLISKDL